MLWLIVVHPLDSRYGTFPIVRRLWRATKGSINYNWLEQNLQIHKVHLKPMLSNILKNSVNFTFREIVLFGFCLNHFRSNFMVILEASVWCY